MNDTQRGVVALIKSAVTGKREALPEGFSLEQAEDIIRRHHIGVLVYEGAVQCGLAQNTPYMQQLFQTYCLQLMRSERQMRAVDALCRAFDDAGVDYLPLKGVNMKKLYPKPELRMMGDADILIRTEQYPVIREVVSGLGYEEGKQSDHELVWNGRDLHLELHKRLIPTHNSDYYSYFGDSWHLACAEQGCRYGMSPEDTYIYQFVHFAKHYRDGGIGLRHVLDLWVYRRAYPQMDEARIQAELRRLHLDEFHANMQALLENWFAGGAASERTDFMSDFLFNSGSWGKLRDHAASAAVKNARMTGSVRKGRVRMLLRALFPTAKMLRALPGAGEGPAPAAGVLAGALVHGCAVPPGQRPSRAAHAAKRNGGGD